MDSKPYEVNISTIIKPDKGSKPDKKLVDFIQNRGFSVSLPILCPADNLGRSYHVLSGIEIIEAFEDAGLKIMWVFIIGEELPIAKGCMKSFDLFQKMNRPVVSDDDWNVFIDYLNANDKKMIIKIKGIGKKYADEIKKNMVTKEALAKILGPKRHITIFHNYLEMLIRR